MRPRGNQQSKLVNPVRWWAQEHTYTIFGDMHRCNICQKVYSMSICRHCINMHKRHPIRKAGILRISTFKHSA